MLSNGLQPNLVTYNTLLDVYAKQAMWQEAISVLDTLDQQVRVHAMQRAFLCIGVLGGVSPPARHEYALVACCTLTCALPSSL